ncbi:hypothetical protein GOODEAATRI_001779, partial [Goodea atripinnis]
EPDVTRMHPRCPAHTAPGCCIREGGGIRTRTTVPVQAHNLHNNGSSHAGEADRSLAAGRKRPESAGRVASWEEEETGGLPLPHRGTWLKRYETDSPLWVLLIASARIMEMSMTWWDTTRKLVCF